jgi:hypothetical protein
LADSRIDQRVAPEANIPASGNLPNEAPGSGVEPAPAIPDHEMLRRIGQGAYGEVWLARNVLGSFRAVKVIRRNSFRDERAYEREFRGIQRYEPISRSSEGLLDIFQAGRNDEAGYYYYVMELADEAEANLLSEDRGPRGERSELRNLKTAAWPRRDFGPRISGFLRISGFGPRISPPTFRAHCSTSGSAGAASRWPSASSLA